MGKLSGGVCLGVEGVNIALPSAAAWNSKPNGAPLAYFEYDAASGMSLIRREGRITIFCGFDAANRLTAEMWKGAGWRASTVNFRGHKRILLTPSRENATISPCPKTKAKPENQGYRPNAHIAWMQNGDRGKVCVPGTPPGTPHSVMGGTPVLRGFASGSRLKQARRYARGFRS